MNNLVRAIKSLISEGDIVAAVRLLEMKRGEVPRKSGLYQAELDILLWHAVRMSRPNATKFLLHIGADPNCVDKMGETPIIAAIRAGDTQTFCALMSTGKVDITHQTNGMCPVSLALFMCAESIGTHKIGREAILRILSGLTASVAA